MKEEDQLFALNTMHELIVELRQIGSKRMLPFQKGIQMTCTSLKLLLPAMKSLYGLKFIMTSRVNQDCLENFFSRIRALGRTYDHPGPAEFLHRMRLLILGQCPDLVVESSPVLFEQDEMLTVSLTSTVNMGTENVLVNQTTVANANTVSVQDSSVDCNEEALIYVCGYIANCFRSEYPQLGTATSKLRRIELSPWLATISRGGLMQPSSEFVAQVMLFECVFSAIHGTSVSSEPGTINLLIEKLLHLYPDVPRPVIRKYASTRTHARIKYLNDLLQQQKKEKQAARRNKTKMRHFTT